MLRTTVFRKTVLVEDMCIAVDVTVEMAVLGSEALYDAGAKDVVPEDTLVDVSPALVAADNVVVANDAVVVVVLVVLDMVLVADTRVDVETVSVACPSRGLSVVTLAEWAAPVASRPRTKQSYNWKSPGRVASWPSYSIVTLPQMRPVATLLPASSTAMLKASSSPPSPQREALHCTSPAELTLATKASCERPANNMGPSRVETPAM